MTLKTILVDRADHKVTITMNRPEKLNALNARMCIELRDTFAELKDDPDLRVLVLTGAGRGFCSGADLTPSDDDRENVEIIEVLHTLIRLMRNFRVPIIGAVNGEAVGAGFSLSLATDVRIASDRSRYSAIFVKRALGGDCGLTYTLPRTVGLSNAFQLLYTGDIIDAAEADRIGLVSKVVPHDELTETVDGLATAIINNAPLAIRGIRRAVYSNQDSDLDSALNMEYATNTMLSLTDDSYEGRMAFAEKRDPVFTGKIRDRDS
jgi:enoyl-CoA hydratase/carnithine racemase